jgi:endonuclease/exonuclease/phosphatase family metal-dependent hydrolase
MVLSVRFFILYFLLSLSFLKAERVSLLTYNLENLFDSVDDPLIEDEVFFPFSVKQNKEHREKCKKQNAQSRHRLWECLYLDWSKKKIDFKMKNLAEVVFKSPGSRGPDVLIVEEVENKAIVEEWNQKHLKKANYSVYHVDSLDKRGIDQAVLTRLPVVETKYHRVEFKKFFKKTKELRGILEVVVQLPQLKLHVLAVHLPSQQSSFEEREVLLNKLNSLALEIPANEALVVGGDFNISAEEWEKKKVFKNYLQETWSLAHREGCTSCKGTYYYGRKKEWSFFDMLLLRMDRQKKQRWSWDAKSVRVLESGIRPQGFDEKSLKGASDHWPLYGELIY